MSTKIRLKRGGRTHRPYYRVVVQDSRNRTRGRVLDELGVYQPCARPEPAATVDMRKALKWLHDGAEVSDTARKVLSQNGVMAAFAAGKKPEDFVDAPAPAAAEPSAAAE